MTALKAILKPASKSSTSHILHNLNDRLLSEEEKMPIQTNDIKL